MLTRMTSKGIRIELVSFPDPTLDEGKGLGTSEHILGLASSGRAPNKHKSWMIGQYRAWAIVQQRC